MKKKTPMEMRKEGGKKASSKSSKTEQSKPKSEMERYVQKRSKKASPSPVMIESKK